MSAYIMNPEHIGHLARFACETAKAGNAWRRGVAKMLALENIRSIDARYRGEHAAMMPDNMSDAAYVASCFWFSSDKIEHANHVDLLRYAESYNYQSCETGDYYDTKAGRLMAGIVDYLQPLAKIEQARLDEIKRNDEKTQYEAAKIRLADEYPQLIRAADDSNAAAKNCRKLLKAAFPGMKFSVRKPRYSTLSISWTDGPTVKAIEEITRRFEDGTFDSMTDCPGRIHTPFMDLFGSHRFVSTYRDNSDEQILAAIEKVGEDFTDPEDQAPTVAEFSNGTANNTSPLSGSGGSYHWSWSNLIHEKLATMGKAKPTNDKPQGVGAPRGSDKPTCISELASDSTNSEAQAPTIREGTRAGFSELVFASKPSETIRKDLKAAGFRWSRKNACWYGKTERMPTIA